MTFTLQSDLHRKKQVMQVQLIIFLEKYQKEEVVTIEKDNQRETDELFNQRSSSLAAT